MALQSAVNPLLGLNYVSESSFLAGIVSMLIHLDSDCYNGGRTPMLHSVLSGVLCSWFSFAVLVLMHTTQLITLDQLILFFTIVPTGFTSHLLADGFTREGVFVLPDRVGATTWFRRRPDPENSWMNWRKYAISGKRGNDDPALNLFVSSASLVALISFLALTPL
jgi:hypothetical protein